MARPLDLVGLGVQPFLARRIGVEPVNVVVGGGSVGSATGIIGHNALAYVISSNTGSGMVLPAVGGDVTNLAGALPGDILTVYNWLGASVVVYAPGTMTFTGDGASTAGTVGISVAAGRAAQFQVLTASTYGVLKGMSA